MTQSRLIDSVAGALFGLLGGYCCMLACHVGVAAGPLAGAAYGAVFCALFASQCRTPGAGIVWGSGFAFLIWLIFPAGILPVLSGVMPSMGMVDSPSSLP